MALYKIHWRYYVKREAQMTGTHTEKEMDKENSKRDRRMGKNEGTDPKTHGER